MSKTIVKPVTIEGIELGSLTERYAVLAFNNDVTTFSQVIAVLMTVCGYYAEKGRQYASKIDREGKAVVYWASMERCDGLISALRGIGVESYLVEN